VSEEQEQEEEGEGPQVPQVSGRKEGEMGGGTLTLTRSKEGLLRLGK
jgi:hypothetical protein